jgi:uridine kinase
MKGDIVVVQPHHKKVAREIVSIIVKKIQSKNSIFTITVGGESGCGKSEISLAISNELNNLGIKTLIFGQDDYFFLPPELNSEKRRLNPDWLGPHIEVNLDLLEQNLVEAIQGKSVISKPLIDYNANTIETQMINLEGVKVIIAEGTYTSLLRNIDTKIFITRNWLLTLEDRKKRNRGDEVANPFIEKILETEHKIIAGHKHLADIIVNDDYEVINVGSIIKE